MQDADKTVGKPSECVVVFESFRALLVEFLFGVTLARRGWAVGTISQPVCFFSLITIAHNGGDSKWQLNRERREI